MASKKDKGEPVGWVTVKGKHFPKWADGTIGWQNGVDELPSKTNKKEQYKQYKDTVAGNIAKLKNSKDLSDAEKRRLVDANKKLTSKMSDLSDDGKLHSKLKVPSQYKFEKEGTYTIHDGNTKRPAVYKYSQESFGLSEGIPGSEYTTHVFSDPKNPRKRYYIHEDELMKNSGLVSTRQAKTQSSNARYDTSRAIDVNGKKVGIKAKETHAQAIYRQAQEEQGLPVDKKFYQSLGETKAPVGHEKQAHSSKTNSSNDGWKKGQNYTGSYTKKEEVMSDKEYEKSVYDRLRKNGWSEKMAKAEAAEQVKVRNDDLGGVRRKKK